MARYIVDNELITEGTTSIKVKMENGIAVLTANGLSPNHHLYVLNCQYAKAATATSPVSATNNVTIRCNDKTQRVYINSNDDAEEIVKELQDILFVLYTNDNGDIDSGVILNKSINNVAGGQIFQFASGSATAVSLTNLTKLI